MLKQVVIITYSTDRKDTVDLEDWLKFGKLKGYCKAKGILIKNVQEINYETINQK